MVDLVDTIGVVVVVVVAAAAAASAGVEAAAAADDDDDYDSYGTADGVCGDEGTVARTMLVPSTVSSLPSLVSSSFSGRSGGFCPSISCTNVRRMLDRFIRRWVLIVLHVKAFRFIVPRTLFWETAFSTITTSWSFSERLTSWTNR